MTKGKRQKFVELVRQGETFADACDMLGVDWDDLVAVWQSEGRTDVAFVKQCRQARARAKSGLKDVMKTGNHADQRTAKSMLEWLEADAWPEPDEAAVHERVPGIADWSERALQLADDLLRELAAPPSQEDLPSPDPVVVAGA